MELGLNLGSKTDKIINYMDSNKIGQALQFYKTGFHNKQLLHFLSSRCPNLKSLHLPCCYGNQLDVGHLPRCLTHLSIDFSLCGHVLDWERNDKKLFGALTSDDLPHLTSLYIRGLSEDGQSGLDQFLVKVSQLSALKKLHLHTMSFRQEEIDAFRKEFFSNLRNLHMLILETCVILGSPTPLDFGPLLVRHSRKLTTLYAIHSNFLTSKDIDVIPDHPSLETLVLDWCPGLTLEDVVESLEMASNLKQVYFSPYGKSETFKSDPFSYDIPFRSIHRTYKQLQKPSTDQQGLPVHRRLNHESDSPQSCKDIEIPSTSQETMDSKQNTLESPKSFKQSQKQYTPEQSPVSKMRSKDSESQGPQIFFGRKLYCHKYMRQIVALLVEERQKLVAVRDNIKERMCSELGSLSSSALNVFNENSINDESDSDTDNSSMPSHLSSDSENESSSEESCHSGSSSFPSSDCSDCEESSHHVIDASFDLGQDVGIDHWNQYLYWSRSILVLIRT